MQIWEWDETGFSLRVIRRKWGKKGKRKKITGQRGGVNVMGGMREYDRKLVFYQERRWWYEQLQQLNDFVKKEWVEKEINRKTLKRRDQIYNYIRQRQLSQAPGCSR